MRVPLRSHNRRFARDASASCGARWWLWGVLPYLWLALFSEALHTHAPLELPAAASASTWAPLQHATGGSAAGAQVESELGAFKPAPAVLDCLSCQWLACSAALLGAVFLLFLSRSLSTRRAWIASLVDAAARRACSRGPPSSLMFAV